MKKSGRKNPDRGLGKFYINHKMFEGHNPCQQWAEILPEKDLLLTEKVLRRLLKRRYTPGWWLLSVFRVTYAHCYPKEFFDGFHAMLVKSGKTSSQCDFARRDFKIALAILNFLYDHDHNGVRTGISAKIEAPKNVTYERRKFDPIDGTWGAWRKISAGEYEWESNNPRHNIQVRKKILLTK